MDNFDRNPDAPPTIFRIKCVESHGGLLNTSIPYSHIRDKLIHELSSNIVGQCSTKQVNKYSTEHSLEVYVLTHDQLEKLIVNKMHQYGRSNYPIIYEG